ncbi:endolytic transglycosylase MltG [Brevundimonas diminuta]|uniref:Endolytic murein transglycosylase n=1 Tax=Brevundimonas diminuta TaxID=293 RepID=A0A410NZY3_BREDI|nr:endolytic transglycosylase MltG [Brevundimonas diminuta]MBD3573502.1 endolytic transglycosylase MltG [Brevundimonas diminuta]QAT15468.1 endolytic transglycosylase MltG [Brevundimonas diminuta]QQB90316.1 endolytic transglycosylase MltG [Brevundimonas diminuta]GEC00208.1 aminodeoxychorismate lyase [Brevundimonas diminuta]
MAKAPPPRTPKVRIPKSRVPKKGGGGGGSRFGLGVGLITAAGTLGLFLVAALVAFWAIYWGPGPKAAEGETTIVTLPSGAGVPAIAANLKSAGVIRSTDLFRAAISLTGADRKIRAGEYEVPSGASLATVVGLLVDGKAVRHYVTLPEGWSSAQAVDILMKQPVLTGEVEVPPEGSLWPETYEVTRGETRAAVVARMQRAAKTKLETLWAARSPSTVVTTPAEAVILASIVEKETGIASERPEVAAVFTNRLRLGMRLESDPTIVYGVTKGRPLGRGILLSELRNPTPWNTYLIDGLPPTPIANPGEEAIKAVLNPPRSEYVFFVADGTGGHVFARTYQEHLLNVARWREIERRKAGLAAGESAPETSPAPMTDEAAGPAIAIPPGAKVIRVPTEAGR